MRRAILVLVCLGFFACGGDDAPTVDAALPDGGATPADADVGTIDAGDQVCATLCACAEQFCAQDLTACLATCADLAPTVRACRTEHCGFAQTNPGLHCPHVAGVDEPGTPPACIAP